MLRDAFKGLTSENLAMIFVRFFSYKGDVDLLNETILEVSKRMSELEPERYGNMGKEAQVLFDNLHTRDNDKFSPKERIDKAKKFYKQYGDLITRVMYNRNDGRNDEDARYSKLLQVESYEGYHFDGQKHEK